MIELILDILKNSILITGLVVVMMMMIEFLNIQSHGRFFNRLKNNRLGQITLSAILGSIPGCMGGFASVSLYTHRMISFGALVAMMIASSGDEAFIMLAIIPKDAIWIMLGLFVVAIISGYIVDLIHDHHHGQSCDFTIHQHVPHKETGRSLTLRRSILITGLTLFIIGLSTGLLGHDHSAHSHEPHAHEHHEHVHDSACAHEHHEHAEAAFGQINLLEETWMNVLFAALCVVLLVAIARASDHFVDEHLWMHVVKKHLPVIFAWTFGVLALIGLCGHFFDVQAWIEWIGESHARTMTFTAVMIVLATLIGLIPESGPHMIFVTLYAGGIVSLPVLLASCISQDGHASIPLLAESKISFVKAKAVNALVALVVGFGTMLFI
jgi:hypothetical protein